MERWVNRIVPPVVIGVILWKIVKLRIRVRRQNEPREAGRGYYLETSVLGSRYFNDIPFYMKNYRFHWGCNVDKFPLTKLPSVAFRHILQTMEPKEQVQLAIASKKTDQMIQMERMKMEKCGVVFQGDYSNIFVGNDKLTIYCGTRTYSANWKFPIIPLKDIKPWKDTTLSHLENTIRILQRCQLSYPGMSASWLCIKPEILKSSTVQEILSMPDLQNFKRISIFGSTVEAKDLDSIMDLGNGNRWITTGIDTRIPEDYTHENAFKFHKITYNDARWVKLNYLFTLRSSDFVHLGNKELASNLRYEELNILIKYWILCDQDMFRLLTISMSESRQVAIRDLFKGLVAVKAFRNGVPFHLIAGQPSETKKFPLLSIQFNTSICFRALDPDVAERGLKDPFTREWKILRIVTEKKDLKEQLDIIQDGPRREELILKIDKRNEELIAHPVYYQNEILVVEEIVEEEL